MLAAVIEQHHDESGVLWPASVAPYDVHVLALHGGADEVLAEAEKVAATLEEVGLDVLLDDRDERPGEKFADADLVGVPLRVIVGKKTLEDGKVDVRRRDVTAGDRVAASDVLEMGVSRIDGEASEIQRRASRADDRRVDGRDGDDLSGPGGQGRSLGRVPEPHRPREPAGAAVERRPRACIAKALDVEPEHFREYRIRVIIEKLEQMPELIDRLYKRLA